MRTLARKIVLLLNLLKNHSPLRSSKHLRRSPQAGMTLIEIMIVLVIIGMIMAGGAWTAMNYLRKARIRTTVETMRSIQNAMTMWSTEESTPCPSIETLVKAKHLQKEPLDGWNHPIKVVACPGEHGNPVDMISSGPDEKDGTEDDIRSWEKL